MLLEWLKKVSAALMPLSCASWLITPTLGSASASKVRSCTWPDPRSITGPRRCGHDPADHVEDRRYLLCRSLQRQPLDRGLLVQRWDPDQPRARVRNFMRRLGGLRAIYKKPRTTDPGDLSEQFPSLVDLGLITAEDQVWATDINYIPLQKGFFYLVAIVDLFSSNVLSWNLSNSLDPKFCLDDLEMAVGGGRRPEYSTATRTVSSPPWISWVGCRPRESRAPGQPGSAAKTTNILVQRLWRMAKYEEVYLHAYSDGLLKISLFRLLWRYCH